MVIRVRAGLDSLAAKPVDTGFDYPPVDRPADGLVLIEDIIAGGDGSEMIVIREDDVSFHYSAIVLLVERGALLLNMTVIVSEHEARSNIHHDRSMFLG